ncbi:L,D-transpeptidase family protein [Bacillus sp. MM2020_1]|nr:L,D-transpeptidase family protein [Bacillus sp. MM2020_1]
MLRRFLIGFIILFLGFSVFPQAQKAEASTISKKQLIIVNKKINKLAFYENGKLVKTYSVATGRTSRLTPEGTFYIREKIKNRPYYKHNIPGGDPRNPLGKRWLGLSKQEDGGYPYAIHGNANESSIGKYISGGCIRMHNNEVIQLFSKVNIGAKVVITTSKKTFNQLAAPYFKNIDIKAPSLPVVNTVGDNVKKVTGKTEKGATVTVKIGTKKYTGKPANSKGQFYVTIPKQKAGKKLYISVKDKAGNVSNTKAVIVKDRTAPSLPTVYRVSDKQTAVSGKAEAGATITVKIGNKKYTGKANTKRYYKVPVAVQKAGTKIYVNAKDKAGNVSKTKGVIVIDKTAPVVTGVSNTTYDRDVTITFNEGKATLDGKVFATGTVVSENGKHTLVVTDAAGNKRTVVFTIKKAEAIAN